ncbi:MAG: hypothetical protein PWP23_1195 [Candidatus Sumerlaeota bacterium]|nr:hypothetical protein [Candidatus Sumerlaeota bacterium]
MKKLLPFVLFVAVMIFSTGCITYSTPVMPPQGLLFSSIQAPLDANADSTDFSNEKQGEASSTAILGLFAFGDASLNTAARDGGLTTVNHVDYSYQNILFFYQQFTIVAYGE